MTLQKTKIILAPIIKNKKPTDSLTKTIKIFAAKTGYEEIIHISESNIPTDAIAVVVKPQVLNEHTINIYKGGTLSKVTFSKDEGNGTNKNTENSAK